MHPLLITLLIDEFFTYSIHFQLLLCLWVQQPMMHVLSGFFISHSLVPLFHAHNHSTHNYSTNYVPIILQQCSSGTQKTPR